MGRREDRKYIFSQLAEIRPRIGAYGRILQREDMQKDQLARFLWTNCNQHTVNLIGHYKDARLVKIANCGLGEKEDDVGTPLCLLEDTLTTTYTGANILIYLAAMALLAALTDQLWDELQKAKAESAKPKPPAERLKCRFCSKTFAKFQGGRGKISGFDLLMKHVVEEHDDKATEIVDYAFVDDSGQPSEYLRASDKIEDRRLERKSELSS